MLHFILQFLPYDPFGKDCMLYSVKNVVEDHPKIEYNDGIRKIFLYTGGKKVLNENRLEDLKRMTEDESFRKELLSHYFSE